MTRFTLPLSSSLAPVSLALLSLTIGGCAGETGYTAAKVCAPAATQACTCSDGMSGAQVCSSTGSWGACLCTGSNPNPNPNPNPPPSWPDGGVGGTDSGIAPGGTGTMTCDQVDACMTACTQGDTTCQTNCYAQGTSAAQAQLAAIESCMNTAAQGACQSQCASESQQCWDCLAQACQSQLDACLGGTNPGTPAPGGTGTSTCAQIDACMAACAETDSACLDTCFYQGTANAQALMTAFEDCLNTAEQGSCKTQCANWDQTCWDCIDQTCQTQLNSCLSN